ncbi:ScbR family autoregulator-binding transcription factor [Streptomyces sp. NPDC023723]|uniref:ScbR family autoregulator-binding transcription factor n=1 Tax=Streptomyces sp. NPDC023723 TaxID=3154323 RepID=UPI0033FC5532
MHGILQDRARATRRSLLEAAACLFAQQGYAGTSVNDISARSGRTSGSIYFHYASKEGIALAVVQDGFASWTSLVTRYEDRSVPPLERLVALSHEIARALAEDSLTRAGARLWAERHAMNVQLPDPFVLWTTAATRLLAQAHAGGQLAAGVRPAPTARTLVPAFYGFCTLTEALEGPQALTGRLSDWWQLVLPSLQGGPGPGPAPVRRTVLVPPPGLPPEARTPSHSA